MSTDIIILAGGIGSRLWPVSSPEQPKQFFKPFGNESMLQTTVKRGLKIAGDGKILIVTNQSMVELMQEDLHDLLKNNPNILILPEPARKNTTAAILFSVYVLNRLSNPDFPALVMPSDHFIELSNFIKDMQIAKELINSRKKEIILFGIKPTEPDTNFGYIKADKHNSSSSFCEILAFKEKPNYETALEYYESSQYFWNAGIFFFSKKKIIEEAQTHTPEINSFFAEKHPEDEVELDGNLIKLTKNFPSQDFLQLKSSPIDKEIMEKAEGLAMIEASFNWSDAGTWKEMSEFLKSSGVNNIEKEIKGSGNFALSSAPVTFCGVEDLIVVVTNEGILVTNKDSSHLIQK
ncbi:MAG: mannose-1-phosphate guanylyltransferase [Spirochaetales bacterium]|nr:mannose-1-phosphate guanylyltransferase [Spirochaetales bacterium]